MNLKLKIWNYRNIAMDNPLEIELQRGITFIMGVNNAGKSNLLRFLYEFRGIFSQGLHQSRVNINILNPFDHILNRKQLVNYIQFEVTQDDKTFGYKLSPVQDSDLHVQVCALDFYFKNIDPANHDHQVLHAEIFSILRNTFYIGAFRSNLTNSSGQNFDISVGQNFIASWSTWADGGDVKKMNKLEDLVSELKDLFGFNKLDIRLNTSKNNLIIKCDDGHINLDDMGSGISQFIIVLANVLIREPEIILIDEPELNLHPKLQEIFIQALAAKCKYGLIATSHSIGLARSSGADRIYSLTKDIKSKLTLTAYGDSYKPSIKEALNELGYSQFVELGGNNILLVEGSSDIKCFREILRKYHIDQHFIIMDLGGSSLISGKRSDELAELKRLNAKSYNVIFDSEFKNDKRKLSVKLQSFNDLCLSLKFNVFPTDVYATDNYITQKAINSVIGKSFTALGKFENLNDRDINKGWNKAENWKMFREMDKADFKESKLDTFITKVLIPLTK